MPLLYHNIDSRIEAFSTVKDSELPYHVIQSHQIHSDGIAIITDPSVTRDDLEGIDAMITSLKNVAICTYKNNDKYYSARAEKNNKCGRIINSIKIINNY